MSDTFMEQAFTLAKKGVGHTFPNPAVGAVLVQKSAVIGEGYHRQAGSKHAEVRAIEQAKKNKKIVQGSTLYITLEPCCHIGKTGRCTEVLINHGVKKVVIGMKDPFVQVNGAGARLLREAGIDVVFLKTNTPLHHDIRLINQPFIKWVTTGLPFVTLKAAVSLDGRIATRTRDSKWITAQKARTDSRRERSKADAVLVGMGTVAADDPELAAHGTYRKKKLLRIILDPSLSLAPRHIVFRDSTVLVATTNKAPKEREHFFIKKGIDVQSLGPDRVSIKRLLQYLGKKGIQHLFVEGGAGIHGSFYDELLSDPLAVDRVLWYIAPKIIGGENALNAVGGRGVKTIDRCKELQHVQWIPVGDAMRFEGFFNEY